MWKVDIYLETDSKVQKNMDRRCGYVLETICAGAIRTVEGFSRISGTYHSANLQNLAAALSRITKTSRICVHTEDASQTAGITLPFTFLVACIVAIWIICNEIISILENIKDMGVTIPTFLIPLVTHVKSQVEDKVNINPENEDSEGE